MTTTATTKPVLLVYNSNHVRHDGKMNECAARVQAVQDELQMRGLWERCQLLDVASFMMTKDSDAGAVHTTAHLEALRTSYINAPNWNCSTCTFGNSRNDASCQLCGFQQSGTDFMIPENKSDVYLCQESLAVALANCNGCCHAVRQLLASDAASVFCLVRPPGHHASSASFGSYCLINTIAVVAKSLLSSAESVGSPDQKANRVIATAASWRKVLIVDWDIHHGDGTQQVVENDPLLRECCCFVSIHRHDKDFWPKTGAIHDGKPSRIVNIPLQGVGYADADYYYIFNEAILPLATRFEPDLILVSAGYDCAKGDQLGRFAVTAPAFGRLSRMLLAVAPGAFILEGGYDVDGSNERPHGPLRDGVASTIQSLLVDATTAANRQERASAGFRNKVGDLLPALPEGWQESVRDETRQTVRRVAERHELSSIEVKPDEMLGVRPDNVPSSHQV